jgi:hypothetical protein
MEAKASFPSKGHKSGSIQHCRNGRGTLATTICVMGREKLGKYLKRSCRVICKDPQVEIRKEAKKKSNEDLIVVAEMPR